MTVKRKRGHCTPLKLLHLAFYIGPFTFKISTQENVKFKSQNVKCKSTRYFNPVNPITLTPSRARAIILHAGGLAKRAQFGKGVEAVYKLIDHLGFLQIDTNYVVE